MKAPISYEAAKAASVQYFNGDEMAADVFLGKYALRDLEGNLLEECPDDMHHRLAEELSKVESKYKNSLAKDEVFNLLKGYKRVVLQGSPSAVIGDKNRIQSVSNCTVVPSPYDSYGGILEADQNLAQLMKRRCGVGIDISPLRPKNALTTNAAQTTDGIGVFMERFSNTTREVAQNGRRGALMISCDIRHPEIETFINIKRDDKRVTGANVSVRVTDEFMNAVVNDEDFQLQWPVDSSEPSITKVVKAKSIWDQIINAAWERAEPGVLFWDRILEGPADIFADQGFKTISTNPCGEIPLCAFDSCRLTFLNLLTYVRNPWTSEAEFDYLTFERDVRLGQRIMDDVVDIELECIQNIINKIKSDPEPERIKSSELMLWQNMYDICEKGRRTGLGITALGDALASLGLTYGSEDSIQETNKIYKTLAVGAFKESVQLAEERGSFPICDVNRMKDHPFYQKLLAEVDESTHESFLRYGCRNISWTTTAPVGSMSTQTQTTSGIEPVFLTSYTRRKKMTADDRAQGKKPDLVDQNGDEWINYTVYHKPYKDWMDNTGEDEYENSPYFNASANDIDWVSSVDIQAAAQKWVSHSISKTCNLPADVTQELVSDVYMRAWKTGCKGFTVYRDGCRTGVLVAEEKEEDFKSHNAPKRPTELPCDIFHVTYKGEKWVMLIGLFNDRPYELFGGAAVNVSLPKKHKEGVLVKNPRKGNARYDLHIGEGDDEIVVRDVAHTFDDADQSAWTRLVSTALRHGTPVKYIVEQLQKEKDTSMFTFAKVMSRTLKTYIKDGEKMKGSCLNCGSEDLIYQEGCLLCQSCGSSKCN